MYLAGLFDEDSLIHKFVPNPFSDTLFDLSSAFSEVVAFWNVRPFCKHKCSHPGAPLTMCACCMLLCTGAFQAAERKVFVTQICVSIRPPGWVSGLLCQLHVHYNSID